MKTKKNDVRATAIANKAFSNLMFPYLNIKKIPNAPTNAIPTKNKAVKYGLSKGEAFGVPSPPPTSELKKPKSKKLQMPLRIDMINVGIAIEYIRFLIVILKVPNSLA